MNTFYTDVHSQELLMTKPESVGLSSEKLNLIEKSVQSFVDQKKIAGAILALLNSTALISWKGP